MSEFRYTMLLLAALGGCYALGYNRGKNYYPSMINRILTSKDFANNLAKIVENTKHEVEKNEIARKYGVGDSEDENNGDDDDQINFKA